MLSLDFICKTERFVRVLCSIYNPSSTWIMIHLATVTIIKSKWMEKRAIVIFHRITNLYRRNRFSICCEPMLQLWNVTQIRHYKWTWLQTLRLHTRTLTQISTRFRWSTKQRRVAKQNEFSFWNHHQSLWNYHTERSKSTHQKFTL